MSVGDKLDVNVQMEFVIMEGWDTRDNRAAPIAKTAEGKTVLFYREFHKILRPGETWLCRIDVVRDNHINAVPISRIGESAPSEALRVADVRLPDSITEMLVKNLTDSLDELLYTDEENGKRIIEAGKKLKSAEAAFLKAKADYDTLNSTNLSAQQKIKDLRLGIDRLKRLSAFDLKDESAEDFWDRRT